MLSYRSVFLHLSFSLIHLGTVCVLRCASFSIFSFLHSHTLKDCEESAPAEEPRKSKNGSMFDRACDFLFTVDCMSGHIFLWIPSFQFFFFFSLNFVIGSICMKSKLMMTENHCLVAFAVITTSHNYQPYSWGAHFGSLNLVS